MYIYTYEYIYEYIYIYIYIYIFNSSISLSGAFVRRFDLNCADEHSKNETAALHDCHM